MTWYDTLVLCEKLSLFEYLGMETLKIVNLIGPPGSGKSTQADLIVSRQEFGVREKIISILQTGLETVT